ncbi:MAG: hypothetical protein K2N25_05470, partial [Muribaculaceae bacterium]|nr:hypothetical protein [Muribaculaceae bacterium]
TVCTPHKSLATQARRATTLTAEKPMQRQMPPERTNCSIEAHTRPLQYPSVPKASVLTMGGSLLYLPAPSD